MICLRAVSTGPVELTLEIDPEAKPGCIDCECTILTLVSFCYQTHQVRMYKRRFHKLFTFMIASDSLCTDMCWPEKYRYRFVPTLFFVF